MIISGDMAARGLVIVEDYRLPWGLHVRVRLCKSRNSINVYDLVAEHGDDVTPIFSGTLRDCVSVSNKVFGRDDTVSENNPSPPIVPVRKDATHADSDSLDLHKYNCCICGKPLSGMCTIHKFGLVHAECVFRGDGD